MKEPVKIYYKWFQTDCLKNKSTEYIRHDIVDIYKTALKQIFDYAVDPLGETEKQRIRRLRIIAEKALLFADKVDNADTWEPSVDEEYYTPLINRRGEASYIERIRHSDDEAITNNYFIFPTPELAIAQAQKWIDDAKGDTK